jgi:hypothetical protein
MGQRKKPGSVAERAEASAARRATSPPAPHTRETDAAFMKRLTSFAVLPLRLGAALLAAQGCTLQGGRASPECRGLDALVPAHAALLAYADATVLLRDRAFEAEERFLNVCNAINRDLGFAGDAATAAEACGVLGSRVQRAVDDGVDVSAELTLTCNADVELQASCEAGCQLALCEESLVRRDESEADCAGSCNGSCDEITPRACRASCEAQALALVECPPPRATLVVDGDAELLHAVSAHLDDFAEAASLTLALAAPIHEVAAQSFGAFDALGDVGVAAAACFINSAGAAASAEISIAVSIEASMSLGASSS